MALTTFSGPVKSDNGFIGAFTSTEIVLQSNNANSITLDAPNGLAASYSLVLPGDDGSAGQALVTNGSGVTSWSSVGAFTSVTATSVGVTNTTNTTALFEPVVVSSTLTGTNVTGGRSKFATTINSTAGSFSNALKADVTYGASGKTTGLGSAFVAELTLSAGTVDGNYAPLEIELNAPTGAQTGTLTSFIYASTQGADVAEVDTNAVFFNLQGVTAASGKIFQTGTTFGSAAATIRVRVGNSNYFLPLYATEITT